MNGSLPPISRLTRASREAQAAATRLPVATEPVKATQSTSSCSLIAAPTSPAPAIRLTTPGRQVVEERRQLQGRERRHLRRLADDGAPGRQRRRHLPAEQEQRVVPGDDAADHAEGVLDHERQLRRLDRRDHPAGAVAADLGVVVERRRAPLDLVAVLDQRLAALGGHRPRELLAVLAQAAGDLVEHLAALAGRRRRPEGKGLPSGGDRRVDLLRRGAADGGDGLGRERVLDLDRGALSGDELAADQQVVGAHEPARATRSSGRTDASCSARFCCQVTRPIATTVTTNSRVAST